LQAAKSKLQNSLNKGGDTFYWRFLEFGTKSIKARPFMRPAMAKIASQIMPIVKNDLSKQIAKFK